MQTSRAALTTTVLLASLACGTTGTDDSAATGAPADTVARDCPALETRPANVPAQRPAFQQQTRACAVTSDATFDVVVVATGLVNPWAVEPLPGGDVLVTEKPGRMRIVSATGTIGDPITGVPAVMSRGQGGLLDVALSPSFETDRTIFWSYAEPRQGGNATSVARGVLSADNRRLEQVQVILRTLPVYNGELHFGSRLAFAPDGKLLVTMGERSDMGMRPQAQDNNSHLGKTLRINPDGSVPDDNPLVGQGNARPEIWTVGHRNIQSAAFDSEGRFWTVEHGPQGGDELNLIEKGRNYGWPVVTYGEEYGGDAIRGAVTAREGFEQPVYYWDPVIAPSGMQFYTGDAFPAWRGSLFIGALREMRLVRLTLDGNRVTGEEHLLVDRRQRIRDVRQGPDGALYVVTDQANGELWRIVPRS